MKLDVIALTHCDDGSHDSLEGPDENECAGNARLDAILR